MLPGVILRPSTVALNVVVHLHQDLCLTTRAYYSTSKRRLIPTLTSISSSDVGDGLAKALEALHEDMPAFLERNVRQIIDIAQDVRPGQNHHKRTINFSYSGST
jgi:hypothetical protein